MFSVHVAAVVGALAAACAVVVVFAVVVAFVVFVFVVGSVAVVVAHSLCSLKEEKKNTPFVPLFQHLATDFYYYSGLTTSQ